MVDSIIGQSGSSAHEENADGRARSSVAETTHRWSQHYELLGVPKPISDKISQTAGIVRGLIDRVQGQVQAAKDSVSAMGGLALIDSAARVPIGVHDTLNIQAQAAMDDEAVDTQPVYQIGNHTFTELGPTREPSTTLGRAIVPVAEVAPLDWQK